MTMALAYVAQILEILPALIAAKKDVTDLIAKGKAVADSGRDPTKQQWDDLNATIKNLRDQLHQP